MKNRRKFLQDLSISALGMSSLKYMPSIFHDNKHVNYYLIEKDIKSLPPSELFSVINLELPDLTEVANAFNDGGFDSGITALLKFYRNKYPKESILNNDKFDENSNKIIARADDIKEHIFQWGPYEKASYGEDIDWAADPRNDIEWVAAMHRFFWVPDLERAYKLTGNESYAQSFVDLTVDWIKKHPLEKTIDEMHPVYGPGKFGEGGWKGYAWLDIQTGIRATILCAYFGTFIHSRYFTPRFLSVLMSSLYDHLHKTEKYPITRIHNKGIFEQRGFINVLHSFPEYKDTERWIKLAIWRASEQLLAQTTTDGVQREMCGSYHTAVFNDVIEIEERVNDLGYGMPDYFRERVKLMADHIFALSTPELGFPMFGDTARPKKISSDRKTFHLYNVLMKASERLKDPKYADLANLNVNKLPKNGSFSFSGAGLYFMRNKWDEDQVYMALHCSPPALTGHDSADNGTFELYANGKWLMPDSGFYTYGNDLEAREWHRKTRVHPTLTIDGKDTNIIGRQLLWKSSIEQDLVCVENESYDRFYHRRTVWFLGKMTRQPFFVVLDEGIGHMEGDIAIHYPLAPGAILVNSDLGRIWTEFDGSNLLIQVKSTRNIKLVKEDGWHAWEYGKREARTSVSAVYEGKGPCVFVSIFVPYKGEVMPEVELLSSINEILVGMDPVDLRVSVSGREWELVRKI